MKFEYLRGFSKKEKVDFTLSFLMVVVICALCAYMAMVFALYSRRGSGIKPPRQLKQNKIVL